MDARRYRAYRAVRGVIESQGVDHDGFALLKDHAEALLLARDDDEARRARDDVPRALVRLVEDARLTFHEANRLWVGLRGCGPRIAWPPTWLVPPRSRASARAG